MKCTEIEVAILTARDGENGVRFTAISTPHTSRRAVVSNTTGLPNPCMISTRFERLLIWLTVGVNPVQTSNKKQYVLKIYGSSQPLQANFGKSIWIRSRPLSSKHFNPLNPELNPICYLLALLGAHHFLHVSRIRVKLLTFRLLMSYIYIYIYIYIYRAPILDVSRSHTTTQHSR